MSIVATKRKLIPAGNHVARAYMIIHIGTVNETFEGRPKQLDKVRVVWELPNLTAVFDEAKGEMPYVIGKEYTLSIYEKSNLRKMLMGWRGSDFTEDTRSFDMTEMINQPALLNVIHKDGTDGSTYAEIASVSPLPQGMVCPPQVNDTVLWEYDNNDLKAWSKIPQFIQAKILLTPEYQALQNRYN